MEDPKNTRITIAQLTAETNRDRIYDELLKENMLAKRLIEQELHEIQKEMTFALYPITINKGQNERNKNKSKTSA
jgi:hypothetical protein